MTIKEAAELKRSGCFMDLPPTFCLCGQPVEIGHALEQMIERVSHQLLRRPSVDGASEPELQMAIGIEAERERRLPFASNDRARPRRTARRRRCRNQPRRGNLDR